MNVTSVLKDFYLQHRDEKVAQSLKECFQERQRALNGLINEEARAEEVTLKDSIRCEIALAKVSLFRYSDALEDFKKIQSEIPCILKRVEQGTYRALKGLGERALVERDFSVAKEHFEKALKFSDETSLSDQKKLSILYALVFCHERLHQTDQKKLLEERIQTILEPKKRKEKESLVKTHRAFIQRFEEIERFALGQLDVKTAQARALIQKKRYQPAIQLLTEVMKGYRTHELVDKEIQVLIMIGNCCCDQGNFIEAEQYYQKALSLSEGEKDQTLIGNAHSFLANVAFSTERFDDCMNHSTEAIVCFNNIRKELHLEKHDGLAIAYRFYGEAALKKGAYDNAYVKFSLGYRVASALTSRFECAIGAVACAIELKDEKKIDGAYAEAFRLFDLFPKEKMIGYFLRFANLLVKHKAFQLAQRLMLPAIPYACCCLNHYNNRNDARKNFLMRSFWSVQACSASIYFKQSKWEEFIAISEYPRLIVYRLIREQIAFKDIESGKDRQIDELRTWAKEMRCKILYHTVYDSEYMVVIDASGEIAAFEMEEGEEALASLKDILETLPGERSLIIPDPAVFDRWEEGLKEEEAFTVAPSFNHHMAR